MSGSPVGPDTEPSGSGHGARRLAFRPDIEGLRAVAILLVVLGHVEAPGFVGGFIGVDIFFVISGFLITSLLVAEFGRSVEQGGIGRISFRGFYWRRARRILPAALTVIAATLIVAKLAFDQFRFAEVQTDALWATFFAANFRAIATSAAAFTTWVDKSPLQNYWSLAVEEQFYLVWPALFALAAAGLRRTRSAASGGWLVRVLVLAVAVSVASFIWTLVEAQGDPRATYFSTLGRAWQLGAGAVVALAWARAARVPGPKASALAGLTGAALIAVTLVVASGEFDRSLDAVLATAAAALLIVAGLNPAAPTPTGALLSLPPIRFIGRISYSLYLWHWPIIVFAAALVPERDLGGAPRGVALFAVSVAVAALSWRLIEEPFRRVAPRSGRWSKKGVAMALFAIFVIATIAVFVRPSPQGAHITSSLPVAGEPTTAEWKLEVADAASRDTVTPAARSRLVGQRSFAPAVNGCWNVASALEVAICRAPGRGGTTIGWPRGRNPLALLVGDGVAAQLRDQLIAVMPSGTSVASATVPFCNPFRSASQPVDEGARPQDTERPDQQCVKLRNNLSRLIADLKPGLVVVAHSFASAPDEVGRFVDDVRRDGAKVLWVGPTPNTPRVPACLDPGSLDISRCDGPLFPLDLELSDAYARAAAVADATWLGMADVFCSAGRCPAVIAEYPVRANWFGDLSVPSLEAARPWLREGVVRAAGARPAPDRGGG